MLPPRNLWESGTCTNKTQLPWAIWRIKLCNRKKSKCRVVLIKLSKVLNNLVFETLLRTEVIIIFNALNILYSPHRLGFLLFVYIMKTLISWRYSLQSIKLSDLTLMVIFMTIIFDEKLSTFHIFVISNNCLSFNVSGFLNVFILLSFFLIVCCD